MKKIFIMMLMLCGAITMSAQQTTVEGSKIWDNTTIGLTVGDVSPMTGQCSDNLRVGLQLGKWFTPSVGVEVEDIATFQAAHGYGIVAANYIGATGLVNMSNAIWKYQGSPRRVEWGLYTGAGWQHVGFYDLPSVNHFVVRHGAFVDWYLGKSKAWSVNWRPGVEYAIAGNGAEVQYNINRAVFHLFNFGVTYRFGHKNSVGEKTHHFTPAYTQAEYDAVVQDLYAAQSKHDTVIQLQRVYVEKPVEAAPVVKVVKINPHFVCGKSDLDPTSVAVLDELAAEINGDKCKYVVTGYASVEGGELVNKTLSLDRANTVKKYLVESGIDADRLEVVAGGPTEGFGPDYESNRVVVVSLAK